MYIVDFTLSNNSLFNLWYNDAPGSASPPARHWRLESEEYRPNQLGASALGSARTNFQYTEEETRAVFVELQLPLISHPKWATWKCKPPSATPEFEGRGTILQGGSTGEIRHHDPEARRALCAHGLAGVPPAASRKGSCCRACSSCSRPRRIPTPFPPCAITSATSCPELAHCDDVPQGGGTPNVLGTRHPQFLPRRRRVRLVERRLVGAFDGRRPVVRRGLHHCGLQRPRRRGWARARNVNVNEISFRPFVEARCPGHAAQLRQRHRTWAPVQTSSRRASSGRPAQMATPARSSRNSPAAWRLREPTWPPRRWA